MRPFEELERWGLLLLSDATLPSLSTLMAGAPVRGSWWSHPQAHAIFRAAGELGDHPDVLVAKLISGKVTFVHRRLWPALLAVARSHEPWQVEGLAASSRSLLARVNEAGQVRTDRLHRSEAAAAKVLEQRLLVHGEEVHTETGAHARALESWDRWASRARFTAAELTPEGARAALEKAVAALNERFGAKSRLPWTS